MTRLSPANTARLLRILQVITAANREDGFDELVKYLKMARGKVLRTRERAEEFNWTQRFSERHADVFGRYAQHQS